MLGFVITVEKQLIFLVILEFGFFLFCFVFPGVSPFTAEHPEGIKKQPGPLCSPSKALTTGYEKCFGPQDLLLMGFRGICDLCKKVQQKFTDKPRFNNVKNSSKVVGVF